MKRALLLALALLGMAGFTALGIWQVERLGWKLDLIERVEARIHAPPVAPPAPAEWASLNPREIEYRRVRVRGEFLGDRGALVQALTERGAGYWMIVPLRTPQGIVLVNRGFIPNNLRTRDGLRMAGPVTVTGLVRLSEPGGGFLRVNDPAADRWYSRDVAAIAAARGLAPVAPFFIDADASPNPGGYPIGGLTVVHFRNTHLIYALTWFGLAAICGFAAFLLLRRRPA